MVEQLHSHGEPPVVGEKHRRVGVANGGQPWRPRDPPVAAAQHAVQRLLDRRRRLAPSARRDQIDVLAQSARRQVGAGECRAAEEDHLVAVGGAECRQDVGDQVVSANLLDRYTEPVSDRTRFAVVRPEGGHAVRAQSRARRSDARARCVVASLSSRSASARVIKIRIASRT